MEEPSNLPKRGVPAPSIGSSVIPIVNRLQDIFAPLGEAAAEFKLPQVAVVGGQSSGKSSVLEALVGRDFLPRGTDICTRRPLVLQLVHCPSGLDGSDGAEWGEFRHLPNKRFYDFEEIRREIQAETDREAGLNKGVSDKQIRLAIYSPNVLTMTLVDLPGITKVPVGDQPNDIEARIRTMIHSYIKCETCIILAVTPANSDLANSDALQMARLADRDGSRTIGVITKVDIMDKGTNACNFLLGNVIPLRLGYIGVVNRSQEDITRNRSIAEALAREEEFFRKNPVYHGLSDRCGIPQLAKKLNQILVQHVRAVLPSLKAQINAQMIAVGKELRNYGEVMETKAEQGAFLLNILKKYCEAFSSMVEGKNQEMPTNELSGGARILYIFQSIFVKSLEEVDPCDDLTDEDVRTAIQNATGPKNALFVPEVPFEVLIRRQIARLLDPSLQCLHFIHDELIKVSHACEDIELQRFPVLRRRLEEVMGKFLRDGVKPADRIIRNIIGMEMDYINTSHPNFICGSKAVELVLQQLRSSKSSTTASSAKLKDCTDSEKLNMSERGQKSRAILARSVANGVAQDQGIPPQINNDNASSAGKSLGGSWSFSSIFGGNNSTSKLNGDFIHDIEHTLSTIQLKEPPSILRPSEVQTEQETVEVEVTKLLLQSYYDIVRKNIQDMVPKAIMHFLVNHAKRDLLITFIQKLYRENLFEEMLQEQEDVATNRKRALEMFHVLQQATWTLDVLPLEAEVASRSSRSGTESTASLPRTHGLSSSHSTSQGDFGSSFTSSPKITKTRKSSHSGEQLKSTNYSNGGFQYPGTGISYPTVEA
ncbi:dynamin-related protein 3A-like [Magnolia sinica]|uniref:dynamin-related protein 3A-like n=1 Tax=Magnolia sinica TaxID=86752 RepID=UPI00265A7F9E|nr:dynamin-related protein 3A-like [Magnolia sinica]